MRQKVYWIGPRESDIAYTGCLFDGSITYYGKNAGDNRAFCSQEAIRINHNAESPEASDFILRQQLRLIEEDPSCRFLSYNPNCVFGAPEAVESRTLCLNRADLMEQMNDKLKFRSYASGLVPMLKAVLKKGRECTADYLLDAVGRSAGRRMVLQTENGSGGEGTYVVTRRNFEEIRGRLAPEDTYILTEYQDQNIPVNAHVIIYDDELLVLPASIQAIVLREDRLLYRGADYITYRDIDERLRSEFLEMVRTLCKAMQQSGYRGVLGVDAMLAGGRCFIVEVNNRFQGSTYALNRALWDCHLPCVQELNLQAFGLLPKSKDLAPIEKLAVNYSFLAYYHDEMKHHNPCVYRQAYRDDFVIDFIHDGYRPGTKAEEDAYGFSLLFGTNIMSLDGEQGIRIHQNLLGLDGEWDRAIRDRDPDKLKIALINQGVVLTERARHHIAWGGGMRRGTYYSLDIRAAGLWINCPLQVKFTTFSPFSVDCNEDGEFSLYYYEDKLFDIAYGKPFVPPARVTSSGIPLDQICLLATDRMRFQNASVCTFTKHGGPCRFCEVVGQKAPGFGEPDILEAVDLCFSAGELPFRHILIGGVSNEIGREKDTIVHMCRQIRKHSDMPIYLMCLPPKELSDIEEYVEAGVTEFGFNLEVFDRRLAQILMPGKGAIPWEQYRAALSRAVELRGRSGAVRSAFIVGLEPRESFLKGIEAVCSLGAAPILSAFRPIPGTDMQNVTAPHDRDLYELTLEAERICRSHGLHLGPECVACQNNTLTIRSHDDSASGVR